MKVEPIKKEIYNKAKKLGIELIMLRFKGGDDEGILDVEVYPWDKQGEIESEIEDWAWNVYDYNGAGDGTAYGDNIIYNIKEGKVSTEEWYTAVQSNENDPEDIEIDED